MEVVSGGVAAGGRCHCLPRPPSTEGAGVARSAAAGAVWREAARMSAVRSGAAGHCSRHPPPAAYTAGYSMGAGGGGKV